MASTAPVMEMDAVGDRSLSAAAEDAGMPIISRAQSLPVVAGDRESHRSTTSPTRATFPFKPASALKDMSKAACNPLPASFRPVVPALSLQPRRCASFPVDSPGNFNCKTQSRQPPEPPEWLVEYVRRSLSPFPISIDSPKDRDCWWLREMAKATKVQVEDGGIELVESEDDGEDVMEEGLMKSSISSGGPDVLVEGPTQSINTKEFIATLDASTEITSSTSIKQLPPDRRQQLQAKMAELKAEMESAKGINPEKRQKMDSLFEKVEGAIQTDGGVKKAGATSNADDPPQNHIDHIRRTTVAITGGTLTAAGVVLIPFPIIPGALVVYGGLLVLATEFDGAKKMVDIVRDPIEKWLADDEQEEAKTSKDHNPHRWDELMGCGACDSRPRKQELDEDFATLMSQKPSLESKDYDGAEKMKSPLKPFLRKLLMFDSQSETGKSDCNVEDPAGTDGSRHATKMSEPNSAQVTQSCHSDFSGCRMLSFDFDGEEDKQQNDRKTEIMSRLCSDGSITLNPLNHDGGDETIRLFSRQSTVNSSYGNDDDCWGVSFGGCNALLSSEGFRTDSITEEKKDRKGAHQAH